MTPSQARDMYRRMIGEIGETITLRRNNASPAPPTEAQVLARVTGYRPEELVNGINQGDRRLIVLAEDVEASGFPVPFKTGGADKAIVRGKPLNISVVDDSTRRVAGVLIAYDITATG
jgi:hypothetical protein